jgi:hypothetical protein
MDFDLDIPSHEVDNDFLARAMEVNEEIDRYLDECTRCGREKSHCECPPEDMEFPAWF